MTDASKGRETGFDPTSPAFLADPYPHLDALRESEPIAYSPAMDRWLVSRHEDVFACQRNRSLGRSYRQRYTDEEFGQQPRDPRWASFWQAEQWSLLELEPPDHTRIRRLVSSAFTPKRVLNLREPAARRSEELLTDLRVRPAFDLLLDYAQPYSVSIICELLGADREHEAMFLHWAHAMVKMYEVSTTLEQAEDADRSARDFVLAAKDLIAHKRSSPGEDLVSSLVSADDDGTVLTEDELVSTIIVLLNAGHEATVNTTGNGMTTMLRHPDQWRLVTSGEVPARQAVEELIRFDPPLQLFERWVLDDDVEVRGVRLPLGSRIAMLYGAANGDPRVFAQPRTLDVRRQDASRHVNFGGGIHACVGAPLARVELDASFSNLARLVPDLQLVEEPERTGGFVIWGYRGVSVTSREHAA